MIIFSLPRRVRHLSSAPPLFFLLVCIMIEIPKIPYEKPVMDIDWFIERIISKWFKISDEQSAKDFLNKKWYYHISSYIKCFCDIVNSEDKTISDNIDFNNVISLYSLDKELQKELLSAVLEIETLIKSDFVQILSLKYNSPFWYANNQNITSRTNDKMEDLLEKINKDTSKSAACIHFLAKYDSKYLPVWHLVEFASFWSFTKLFHYLKDQDLFIFCKKYWAILQNWNSLIYDKDQLKQRLKWLADLRNRLAHLEITRSPRGLPWIILPWFQWNIKLNTVSAYIQLMHHFLKMIDENMANDYYNNCYDILFKISQIWWIHSREFNKIWLNENREKRFNKNF